MEKAYRYAVEVKVLVAMTGEVILGSCLHANEPECGWSEEIAGDNSYATALKMLDLHSGYCSELKEEDGYVRVWSSSSVRPGKYKIIRDVAGIRVLERTEECHIE